MAVVVFDYSAWALRYPELAPYVSAPAAQVYFNEAQIYCDNSDFSPVQNIGLRTTYLNMLTAHIAWLTAAPLPVKDKIIIAFTTVTCFTATTTVTAFITRPLDTIAAYKLIVTRENALNFAAGSTVKSRLRNIFGGYGNLFATVNLSNAALANGL